MGLLDSIEKLITEHGSAAILRERIALAKDEHAALEKKASSLEAENVALKSQLQDATSEIEGLQNELAELREKLPQEKSGNSPSRLEEVREKILVLLSEQEGLADQQVAQGVGVSSQVACFHLQELQSADMVRSPLKVGQSFHAWQLNPAGLRYLVVNGLVA